ncbi:hypothetical protein QF034_005001 [Streptomyces africanus]|uniref:Tat pathway signal protein n=1 Tax=Streptomyces africanus TaxID=231024 RepID=A0ABU0QTP0_9ACTN|nr:Tat pathway signal protein [Streptomyces africanus]MDQ0750770.1 hypothetical protein [Streptomyces africanus]
MNFLRKRSRAVAAVLGAAMVTTLGLAASPASAKVSDGWIRGYAKFSDDWDDEGELSRTSAWRSSNATCLWQRILWAEGAYATNYDGKIFEEDHIDGDFGWRTLYSTIDLQKKLGESADGIVGEKTFSRVNKHMYKIGGSTDSERTLYLRYEGKKHTFDLRRNTEGKYVFPDRKGDSRQAGYKYHSCG